MPVVTSRFATAIEKRRLLAAMLDEIVELRSLREEIVADRGELAILRCAQANALLGARTMAGVGKHHAAVDADFHRPIQLAGLPPRQSSIAARERACRRSPIR